MKRARRNHEPVQRKIRLSVKSVISGERERNQMSKSIDRNGFIQINIIVRDIETAAEKWAQVLGVEKPEIRPMHLEGGD